MTTPTCLVDRCEIIVQMLWTLVTLFVAYKLVAWALSRICINNYHGKHVLITGCDSGFGHLATKHLDGLGFSVFATCLTSDGANSLQKSCSERVTTLLLDVTDEESIASAQKFVESKLPAGGGLWGLVNNAGVVGSTLPIEMQTGADWQRCLSVNLFGMINVTRAFLPLLRQGRGRVVNMSSIMGRVATIASPYCVSKFGVEAYSDGLRFETYPQGIKVCIIEPGFFKTDIMKTSNLIEPHQRSFDRIPDDIKRYYPNYSGEKFASNVQKMRERASDDIQLVVDAITLALTSRFPPTRQLVGNDARYLVPILLNLPTPLYDWIKLKMAE